LLKKRGGFFNTLMYASLRGTMDKNNKTEEKKTEHQDSLPKYQAPQIITFSEDELLAKLGPAQACSPYSGAVVGC
jgi:hypothetical protein